MTKNDILKKIGIIIIELREQYDLTQLNRNDLNDIELELFVANAHFLTDHIEILRKLNNHEATQFRQRVAEEPKYFEPVVKPTIPEEQPAFDFPEEDETIVAEENQIEEPIKEEHVPEAVIRHELVLDEPAYLDNEEPEANEQWATEEEMEVEIEEQVKEEEPVEEPVAEAPAEPEIIEPEPEVTKPGPPVIQTQIIIEDANEKPLVTINQILSAQVASASHHSELQPISDLKSAITLNDKLLYVRDLFNGYSMAYGEAIEILNRFSRFEEADNFLKINYYTKNNWEAKQATTDKFYELLQRRFQA
ncbi:MAG: hypothetical protein ABIN91_22585 [Mucilaginibacter sp.]|uniref:hypothetical protein n=1 Tax=Mucilaginibacter sp. TaxID=1882438 RepID=UPI003263F168